MLSPFIYNDIYLLVTTIITIAVVSKYFGINDEVFKYRDILIKNRVSYESTSIFICVCFILFIGFRPVSGIAFGDMGVYSRSYELIEGTPHVYSSNVDNLLWDNLFSWWASNKLGFNNLMLLMCTINFGSTFLACRKLFPNDTTISFLVFLGAFSTFSYATNGVKAGTAAGVFLLAIAYYRKIIICVPLMLISLGFHHSMKMPIAAFIIAYIYKNPKHLLFAWLLCVAIAAAHITMFQNLFAELSKESGDINGAGYLTPDPTDESSYITGFRLDFILYSAAPVWVGWKVIIKNKISSNLYSFLIRLYLILNCIWMLCMYASYSNRIAYLSWFLYPIVLIFPYLRVKFTDNQYKIFGKVVLLHLGFTLAMRYIYYAFLH